MSNSKEQNEIWKPVIGWEDSYEVSSLGRVRRIKAGQGARTNRCRSLKLRKDGYLEVALQVEGKRKDILVHILVAEAFIGPRKPQFTVNHKNLDKTDNRPENLEYLTVRENVRHAASAGVMGVTGELNGSAKLTRQKARDIRERHANGDRVSEIARDYGVTHRTIDLVVNGKTWAK